MSIHVRRWVPNRAMVLVADRGYAVLVLLDRWTRLSHSVTVITRCRFDGALCEPAPVRRATQKGCPRRTGNCLLTVQQMVDDPATCWTTVIIPRWYSQEPREIARVSATCVWYHKRHAGRAHSLGRDS